jgi:hypothetical protein
MGSDAEPEAMARLVIYGNRHMIFGCLAGGYGFTVLDGSRPDPWRYLMEAEPDNSADVADQR